MEIVSSDQNTSIKYLKKIYNTRQRKKEKKFILEGKRIIQEAVKADADIEQVFVTPEFEQKYEFSLGNNIKKKYVKKDLLDDIASTVTPQGIIAIVRKPDYDFSEIVDKKFILVLDRIQDPGNMGTLIRTAVAAGIGGIIALKGSVDIYNLKVIKATMGAIFNIPVLTRMDLSSFIEIYKKSNFNLITTDIKSNKLYNEVEYKEPLFLVIGNEAGGIRNNLLDNSDEIIKIPILGKIDSLNAGVSGGIIMYDYINKNILSGRANRHSN